MLENLVLLKNNKPVTTSLIIADKTGIKHESIIKTIKKYKNDFGGVLGFEIREPKKGSKGGQPQKYIYLDEEQTSLLIMYLNNGKKVREFKKSINRQFHNMKKWILENQTQKQNQNYIETRNQAKLGRKQQTDVIKDFVEYATSQGSKSANKYYMIISNMENKAFFIIKQKFPNLREILRIDQLSKIIVADMIIKNALKECMNKGMYYKDIYQVAKERIIIFSNSLGEKEYVGDELNVIKKTH